MNNLRKLPDDLHFKIRTSGSMTLIYIPRDSAIPTFANTATGKDKIIEEADLAVDTVLVAWNGNYKTDIFEYTSEDHRKHYR
jgi:hypothetical protein